jgi:hypothetical protein
MKIAKALVLPVVAVAVISIFCKAQNRGGSPEPSASAAPSVVADPAPYTVPVGDQPQYSISNYVNPSAELINAGLNSIGKEDSEPRKVHFEFTLTLPAAK